jgi:general secretion pathway protein F
MSHFRYRAITPTGDFVAGEVEAPSREEVIQRIEYLGHVTIEVEAATTSMLARSSIFRNRTPRPRDMTIFLRQLAVLVGAGLTLEAALQALGDDTGKALA